MQQQQHYQAEVQPGAAEHAADHVHVVLVPYGDDGDAGACMAPGVLDAHVVAEELDNEDHQDGPT